MIKSDKLDDLEKRLAQEMERRNPPPPMPIEVASAIWELGVRVHFTHPDESGLPLRVVNEACAEIERRKLRTTEDQAAYLRGLFVKYPKYHDIKARADNA